jgi:serine protease Do
MPHVSQTPKTLSALVATALLSLALTAPAPVARAARPDTAAQKDISRAVNNVYPALVRIFVVMDEPESGRMRKLSGAGSGVIISPKGYVVTNHHVAGNAARILCVLSDQEEIEARLVGTDALSDIAVLKLDLESRPKDAKPLRVAKWGDSDKVRVGDVVFAMGCPAAVSQSVTRGIVSNTQLILPRGMKGAFRLDGESVGSIVRWLAHDAVIFGGNSGGPLVDVNGRVIGINEMGLGSLGGAIPGNLARDVAERIIIHGHVERSWVGIEVQPRLKSGSARAGVLVSGVIKGSPADAAGLRPGDVITSFDGIEVDCGIAEELPIFNRVALSTPIGEPAKVKYLRENKPGEASMTPIARERALPKPREIKAWGVIGRDISARMARELRRKDANGVYVQSLRPGGPSADAKPSIGRGDIIRKVNGKAVRDVAHLRELTAEATKGKTDPAEVLVDYDRGTSRLLTVVKVGKEPEPDKPALARKPWPAVDTQVLTRDLAEALGLAGETGVRVVEVYPGRAGQAAGLEVGDIILEIDNMDVEASEPTDTDVFETMIRRYDIGAEVDLKVVRDKQKKKITMKLEAPPTAEDRLPKYEDEDFDLTVRDLSVMDRIRKKENKTLTGVLVERADAGGWAAFGGLSGGDVILSIDARPTPDVGVVEKILIQAKKDRPKRIVFFVKRGIHTAYVEIEPDWKSAE